MFPHDELGAYYERAAVVCVPSRREGYGVVAREAMAHARPVVATATGGLADAVSDGETGLVVPLRADLLRGAILQLLGDRMQREQLGAAARERARRDLAWPAFVEALLRVYGEAIAQSR